jgi:hypothetical protein
MSTYTPSLGLELITPGSQAGLWGNTTNNSLNLIDQAITGVTPISFASASGSTYTLTDFNGAEDESRAAVLNITGSAIGANTIVIPNKQKTYLVRNNTGQDVTFRTPTPSATYAVGAGYSILIFCDGNNNVFTGIASPGVGTLSVNAGGTGATTFTAGFVKSTGGTNALTSSATVNAATELTGATPVANGGTGAVSLTSGALLVGNGTGTVASLSGGVVGYVPTWNGSSWVSSAPTASGVTSVSGTSPIVVTGTTTPTISLTTVPTTLGGTGATSLTGAGIVTTTDTQTISGTKTFSGIVTSTSWYMNASTRMYYNSGDQNIYWVINGNIVMNTGPLGAFKIYNTLAQKPGGGTWVDSSDARLKESVTPLTGALSKINALNPVSYEWKYDRDDVSNVGFVAQEVEPIFPRAVSETDPTEEQAPFIPSGDKVKNIGWQNEMFAYLVGAIKELKAEVDALKAAK